MAEVRPPRYTLESIMKGLREEVKPVLRVFLPFFAAAGLIVGFDAYRHHKTMEAKVEQSAAFKRKQIDDTVVSPDGSIACRSRLIGDQLDLVITDKTTGIEKIVSMPESDEAPWNLQRFNDNKLLFTSDKDSMWPSKSVCHDYYTYDLKTGAIERESYNTKTLSEKITGDAAMILFKGLAGTGAAVMGLAGLYALLDVRRRRSGLRPYNLHKIFNVAIPGIFATKATQEGIDTSEWLATPSRMYTGASNSKHETPEAQEKALRCCNALGDDFVIGMLPYVGEWLFGKSRTIRDRSDYEPKWAGVCATLNDALYYDTRSAADGIERLVTQYPTDVFTRTFAVELYVNLARVSENIGLRERLLSRGAPIASRQECENKAAQHALELAKLCNVHAGAFQYVQGSKNKVFYSELPALQSQFVFKHGDVEHDYAMLERVQRALPFGDVPFPVALLDADELFPGMTGKLAIQRRLPGQTLDRIKNRWEYVVGEAIGKFQRGIEYVKDLPDYDRTKRITETIVPRLAKHLRCTINDEYAGTMKLLDGFPRSGIHGDCSSFNVIIDDDELRGRRARFVDLESAARSAGIDDVGCLLAHYATPAGDIGTLLDGYNSKRLHNGVSLRHGAWLATMHQWLRQVSTLAEWRAQQKIADGAYKERAKGYLARFDALRYDTSFGDAANKYGDVTLRAGRVADRLGAI